MPFVALTLLALVVALITGWVMNIVELVQWTGDVLVAEFVLRVIGIFVAPLGAIMGLFV